jgi:hypothetical protein
MKKISLLIGLLVIVFAATAYAQPVEFKMSGFMDFVAATFRNIPSDNQPVPYAGLTGFEPDPNSGLADHAGALANSRARLKFQANAGKELSATIFFEMDSATWGDSGDGRNNMGRWNADRAAVEVKHAFFDVAIPYFGIPTPMTMRFGVQPFAIRDSIFFYADGAGITWTTKADPVKINLMWGKPHEGRVYSSDDTDIYAVDVSGNVEGFSLGAHGMWQSSNGYPIRAGAAANQSADLYWVGGYADGKWAGFNFSADLIYDWGKVKDHNHGIGVEADDIKYSGFFAGLTASFPWEIWDFGGGAWYGSGADANKDHKRGDYVQPVGSEPGMDGFVKYGSIFYGSGLFRGEYGYGSNGGGTQSQNNYIGGTWGGYLYAGLKLTPWYKVYLHGMYLGDTTKHANTVGNAQRGGELSDDNAIGFEFTLSNIFKVYNNLDLYVMGGYMLAGDGLDMYSNAKGGNVSMDDPYVLATRLVYSF